jgi:hypothetical protein
MFKADMTCFVVNIFEDGEWAIMGWKDLLGLRGCGFFHVIEAKIKLFNKHGLPVTKTK